jgi:hypothetical protein
MSWFAVDFILHIVLGFAINEVYIMSADWIFIIPISIAFLFRDFNEKVLSYARLSIIFIAIYLWVYNGVLITNYFLS